MVGSFVSGTSMFWCLNRSDCRSGGRAEGGIQVLRRKIDVILLAFANDVLDAKALEEHMWEYILDESP